MKLSDRCSELASSGRCATYGFSLIELMIVIAVVAILASLAFGSYQSQTVKARRADAQAALMGLAQAMERHKTVNGSYEGAAAGGGDDGAPTIFATQAPIDGGQKFYDLSIEAVNGGSSFTLRATPIAASPQADDGYFEILSTGLRRWDRNDNGSIDSATENCWAEAC